MNNLAYGAVLEVRFLIDIIKVKLERNNCISLEDQKIKRKALALIYFKLIETPLQCNILTENFRLEIILDTLI